MQAINTISNRHHHQKGAVSLFVVLFATLLITIVTVSFVRTMVDNQLLSTNQTLAQSAYDSAQAGVQDAERALLRYETCQSGGSCSLANTATWNTCNGIIGSQLNPSQPPNIAEIPVQQSGDGQTSVNQAYTCVKVDLNTDNVVGSANESGQVIIPLQGTGNFTNIEVNWFSKADLTATSGNYNLQFSPLSPMLPLLQQYDTVTKKGWNPATPSVLRAQLIQFSGNGFKLSDFDPTSSDPSGGSDANTLFLYPVGINGSSAPVPPGTISFALDNKVNPVGKPVPVSCIGNLGGGGYACSEIISLPDPIGSGARTAYLRLTPMYNASHFSVSLLASADPTNIVQFENVQPSIDSTGRANDLFSRIQTRVNLINNYLPYPTDAVEVTGNFCKNFAVTDKTTDYASINAANTCKP